MYYWIYYNAFIIFCTFMIIINDQIISYSQSPGSLISLKSTILINIVCSSEILKNAHLTHVSTTQYPFRFLYLPIQIQMDNVYRKSGFNLSFQDFYIM